MLDALNGMFAFAIWDAQDRTLFAARDRLGVKPFYYAWHENTFWFASEQKALCAAGVPREFDQSKWEELLCFRYCAGEETPLLGIRRLLPGHSLTVREGEVRIRCWWDLADRIRERRESPPIDAEEWFRETLYDSVSRRRISDVPVGVLLSGGLDSASVAAILAAQAGTGIASFTVRFDDPAYDEGELAQLIAVRCGLEYHELTVSPKSVLDDLRQASWINDEPLAHGNEVQMLAIARVAKDHVSVLLSGEGADETLGGYVRYQPLRWPGLLSALRRFQSSAITSMMPEGRLKKLARFLSLESLDAFALFNVCDVLPGELRQFGLQASGRYPYREQVLEKGRALYGPDLLRQAMFLDQHTFLCSLLDRNDRMTMGASIECREPFLDYRVVETLASLPTSVLIGRETKQLLRNTMAASLPRSVRRHRKWGFGVPWGRYLRDVPDLREWLLALPQATVFRDSPLDCRKIEAAIQGLMAGNDSYLAIVKEFVMIGAWIETFASPAPRSVRVHEFTETVVR